jgi:hypothetical protein
VCYRDKQAMPYKTTTTQGVIPQPETDETETRSMGTEKPSCLCSCIGASRLPCVVLALLSSNHSTLLSLPLSVSCWGRGQCLQCCAAMLLYGLANVRVLGTQLDRPLDHLCPLPSLSLSVCLCAALVVSMRALLPLSLPPCTHLLAPSLPRPSKRRTRPQFPSPCDASPAPPLSPHLH